MAYEHKTQSFIKIGGQQKCLDKDLPQQNNTTLKLSVYVLSCDKLKPLYLHYHSACGQQT